MEGAELRILEAAIAAIEEYGFQNVTVRRIAAKAGVNIAAINYYFRTKDQLIEKVIRLTLDNTFDWGELAHAEDLPPKEMLIAVMEHLSMSALNYPAITRAHFYEAMVNGRDDSPAVREMNAFMETLCSKLQKKRRPHVRQRASDLPGANLHDRRFWCRHHPERIPGLYPHGSHRRRRAA